MTSSYYAIEFPKAENPPSEGEIAKAGLAKRKRTGNTILRMNARR